MRRGRVWVATTGVAAVVMLLPAAAAAVVVTITSPFDATSVASCPGSTAVPCTVVSRTTAIQEVVGATKLPMRLHGPGRIVGWQIVLSTPTDSQIKFFDANEGGPAEAAIAVLRHVKALDYRLEALTPVVHLQPYFGQTATFALDTSIPVSAGEVVALVVPTWVPALELKAGRRTAWRASRPASKCSDVTHTTAMTKVGEVSQFGCIYQTALINFGAVEISTP